MIEVLRTTLWHHLGGAIDMLENAIAACPDELWSDRSRPPELWYSVYHALFYLDLYLSDSVEGFAPPTPFTLGELEDDVLPERVYTRDELHAYLVHGREKCRTAIDTMTDERANRRCGFEWVDASNAELLLYNMRHVQHHAAQLNLVLREATGVSPGWIRFAS